MAAAREPLHVVATAGHVDHGKSSLILRLTGRDPDRWEEEKRRGLTIDLGFAWATLPSGREIGFVDVPGHERFVRNMLAGIGPVRLVLFVVAADEGWKPQSEEHLAIVDVLGAEGGVVALTKSDLVDADGLALVEEEVRDRLAGTSLSEAPIVVCSAVTGTGLDHLRTALDAMIDAALRPEEAARPRMSIDRSFTIRGAGTVVTGTLTGGPISVGDEVELHPSGTRARVRSLQTHERPVQEARPVSRVAANLVGLTKEEVQRGDVLTLPGEWRATGMLEVSVAPVRGLDHPLTARGAYKLYVGAAERDARLRLYGRSEVIAGEQSFARIHLTGPVVAEVGDRFVLREAGRRETVAGGVVLDVDPPRRPGARPEDRLTRRRAAGRGELPALLVRERLAVRAADLPWLTGSTPISIEGALRVGAWWVAEPVLAELTAVVWSTLEGHHRDHPLRPGLDREEVRRRLAASSTRLRPALEQDLATGLLEHLEREGTVVREGTMVRLTGHRVSLGEREQEARDLVSRVEAGEPTPPDVDELIAAGNPRDLIEAACTVGRLTRVSKELVFTPGFVARAEKTARELAAAPEGLTVSGFRRALATTRKYALPLLGHFDGQGITRRDGDVRRLA